MHILFNSCYDRGTIILITNTKLSPIYLISNADKTTALDGTVAFLMSSWLPNCNQLSGQKKKMCANTVQDVSIPSFAVLLFCRLDSSE
ncbi:hypothetical protein Y032_0118g765 [Ancylostoma ceylanicum]|uniref:Uncharacterized protein n=1 Tax=Ancylostoma ceylanicum TaxID=53326 RepID=A0A016TBV0_9BILA|nr:hypothetical protein Y032_0118g765 [Ancylostoma ceylanicum]